MITRRRLMTTSAAGLALASAGVEPEAIAQAAGKTVRMLVGFPPGGPVDTVARLLVNEMRTHASTIIVENRPGAGGRIALNALKSSPADGSVAVITPASMLVIQPHLYNGLTYNALDDFIPVTTVCDFPFLLTVGPKVPSGIKTLTDFIQWCRANPTYATYGTAAAGSMLHFTGVMLARAAGFDFLHVPYQGAAPAVQDLLAGQIAAAILPIPSTLPYIQSGNLRALATTGPQRSSRLPDVLTIQEAGYPTLEATEWFGVFVPVRTPAEAVSRLNGSIHEALKASEVKLGFAKLNLDIAQAPPSDFARLLKADFERWGPIVRASGFTPQD
jgi:tripartite-type tricarboxylate transporter receptor subunit TctC